MAVLLGCLAATVLMGQDRGPPGRPEERGPAGRPEGLGFPPLPVVEALDANRDGKLSAAEIEAASASLKKLDRNGDGRLNAEELGWPPRRPEFPRGGPPFGPRGGRGLAERIMARDADSDGKVTPDELPKSMHFLFARADANKDRAIDKEEAQRFARQHEAPQAPPAQGPQPPKANP